MAPDTFIWSDTFIWPLIREFPQLASSNSAVRVPSPGLGPDSPQGEWLAVRNTEGNELNPKGEWLDVRDIEGNELNGVTPKLVSVLRSSKRQSL